MADAAITREKFLYTVPEAAKSLGVGTRLIWFYIKRRELRVTKLGRRTLINKNVLEKFCLRDHAGARG